MEIEKTIRLQQTGKIVYSSSEKVVFSTLKSWYDNGKLVLSDWFQRDYCWSRNQEVWFVHTVLNHPEIIPQVVLLKDMYLNGTGQDPLYYVADGQHRLLSILENVLNTDKGFCYKSKEISESERFYGVMPGHKDWENFTKTILEKSIDLKIILNVGCDEAEIDEVKSYIFRKWNNGSKVNDNEKRSAFTSDLNKKVIHPLKESLTKEQQYNLLTETSKSGKFNNLIEILWYHFTEKNPERDPKEDQKVENHKKVLNDNFDTTIKNFKKVINATESVLSKFNEYYKSPAVPAAHYRDILVFCIGLYKNKELRSISAYSDYLTSIIETFHRAYARTNNFKDWKLAVPEDMDPSFIEIWDGFRVHYGSAQDGARVFKKRMEFLYSKRNDWGELNDVLDSKRNFTMEQKHFMYERQGGLCVGLGGKCKHTNERVKLVDMDADHIKEHSTGGLTDVSNGQLLCINCHKEKTRRFVSKVVES